MHKYSKKDTKRVFGHPRFKIIGWSRLVKAGLGEWPVAASTKEVVTLEITVVTLVITVVALVITVTVHLSFIAAALILTHYRQRVGSE